MPALLNISFDFDFYPLLVVVAIAWTVPMLMSMIGLKRVPTVIVEILAGYFIGRYFLSSFPGSNLEILDFLALTGFIFLMFLTGLEIDMGQIFASMPRKRINFSKFLTNPLLVGLTIFLSTLVLSYLTAFFIDRIINLESKWYFALIMITTSVGIIVPVLKNRGEINTRFGQMLILTAAIADVLSIVLFTISAFVLKEGLKFEVLWLLYFLGLFAGIYLFVKLIRKVALYQKIIYQLSHAASQIKVRGTIMLILILVVLSQIIGNEVILLGAFLGGLILSLFLHKDRSLLIIKLDGMGYGFFIPIFFIMVGVKFNPQALKDLDNSLYLFLALLLFTLYAVKVVPALIWSRLFGYRQAISGGFLIASRLSLIIAASSIGMELGVISEGINACFILMAVITCLLSPVIYNQINPRKKFPPDKTVIIGGSSTAVLLARRLFMHNREVLIIEKDPARFNEINIKGIQCVMGDGNDQGIYNLIKLIPQNYVVVLTSSDEENIRISEMLRRELNHENIITKANKQGIQRILKQLEVEYFDATRVIANTIESLILRPATYHTLVESFEDFSVEEIKITNKSIDGRHIHEIPFHPDGTVMMIRRGNNMYIPHGETYLRLGDVLNVFGTPTALEETRRILS